VTVVLRAHDLAELLGHRLAVRLDGVYQVFCLAVVLRHLVPDPLAWTIMR
jgi:hypothetical protein